MQNTKLIIWDMDGVLYPFNERSTQATITAIAEAVTVMNPDLTPDIARHEAMKSHHEHQNPFKVFTKTYRLDFDTLMSETYSRININNMIEPDPDINGLIRVFGSNQAILTRADMAWTQRVIDRLDLGDIFGDHNIIACNNAPDMDKAASTRPFLMMLEKTGFKANEAVMVEDTVKNLQHAKMAGLTTVLVYGDSSQEKPLFVDHIFDTTPLFLHHLRF